MKIAVNTRLLLSHRMEGIARYIYETTRRMVLSHPEVAFHFLFDRPYDAQFIFADNVIPHVIQPPARHPLLWYLWYEWAIPRKLRAINPDVFYSGDMYMSLKTDIPTVMVSHDLNYEYYPETLPWMAKKYYQKYSPLYHRKATKLISVSQATKDDIVQTYGIKPEKITVAHNAVPAGFGPIDNKQAIRDKHTRGLPYFVYIGSLHPRKNIKRLLEAFDLFKSQSSAPHQLVLYGRIAWKTSDIFKTYEQMQFKEAVHFIGSEAVSVQDILGAAFGLSYVSLFEGFGIPILEAFECGIPVITSNSSSMPEVAGDAALLVNPLDINSIASAMRKLVDNKELCLELVARSRVQKGQFSWDESAEIVWGILEKFSKGSYS